MKHIDRLISLSVLGVLTLSFAPLASAEDGDTTVDREAVRAAIRACREDNEDRESRHDCVKGVLDEHGIQHRRRLGRRIRRHHFVRNLSDEVKDELKACRDDNEDRAARRECAKAVFEANGIEKPEGPRGHGRGHGQFIRNLSDEVKDELQACRDENEDRETRRECAKAVFEANGIEKPEGNRRGGRFGRGGWRN